MCAASIGSVMGYDEIFPRLLDIVGESRRYAPETDQPGIGKTKGILNELHREMAEGGYTETHIHHEGEVPYVFLIDNLMASTLPSIASALRPTKDISSSLIPLSLVTWTVDHVMPLTTMLNR